MTDSNTINYSDTNARLDLLTEQLEKMNSVFLKFSNSAVELLSGQRLNQANAATQQPAEATIVKRGPGRPRKAQAAPVEAVASAPKVMHPTQVQALNLIMKRGRVAIPELADEMKEKRELVHYHVGELAKEGKVVEIVHFPKGRRTVFAYRPDWANLKTV